MRPRKDSAAIYCGGLQPAPATALQAQGWPKRIFALAKTIAGLPWVPRVSRLNRQPDFVALGSDSTNIVPAPLSGATNTWPP